MLPLPAEIWEDVVIECIKTEPTIYHIALVSVHWAQVCRKNVWPIYRGDTVADKDYDIGAWESDCITTDLCTISQIICTEAKHFSVNTHGIDVHQYLVHSSSTFIVMKTQVDVLAECRLIIRTEFTRGYGQLHWMITRHCHEPQPNIQDIEPFLLILRELFPTMPSINKILDQKYLI